MVSADHASSNRPLIWNYAFVRRHKLRRKKRDEMWCNRVNVYHKSHRWSMICNDMKTSILSKDMDACDTIFTAGVIIYTMDHRMKLVCGFYLFLEKLDSEPFSPRNLVVGLCSVILLNSYLIYFFHNVYNATNLLTEYDFSTSQWHSARNSPWSKKKD